jgi:hypothetical protein
MKCVPVEDVTFDEKSIEAIEDIKRRTELAEILPTVMATGVMVNIFAGKGALKSAYNIAQTDFEALAKAIAALPHLERVVIRRIAQRQQLDLYRSPKEVEFWKGVEYGCSIR